MPNLVLTLLPSGQWQEVTAPLGTFTLPPLLIVGFIGSVVLPLLVGLVTNTNWSARAKSLLHLALSAATGLVTELATTWADGGTYDWGIGLLTAFGVFIGGVGTYQSVYKSIGSSGQSIADKVANTGNVASPPDTADGSVPNGEI